MIFVQLAILLLMILIGSRMKRIGLGVMGMVGLLIFVLVFHMRPVEPPVAVLLIILAIVTTAATLQAAGGLDYLVSIAERIIRRNPSQITFIAPFTTYFLCLFAGTKVSLFTSMASVIVSVLGVVWMSATFMGANESIPSEILPARIRGPLRLHCS